ncbi:hypothetical protein SEA_TYPHA_118 [Mycobacterium phage Typha]|uniref:Uncharacterized protein n=1 Tax=Mycobacterium phage Typha TaxID=2517971 RepID=A0A482J883_9CAUD|nr:hypothetical protein KCH40_gp051 [Mycobacterium phage Typha]QBP29773.1 hypothetical protein SEA_TYPHA_118 [Mycobacterium phage Typha]URM86559.1 hypothetical protein PBI_HILLTOPFARM_121 [Mycobacterium phage Hilltopfarm]
MTTATTSAWIASVPAIVVAAAEESGWTLIGDETSDTRSLVLGKDRHELLVRFRPNGAIHYAAHNVYSAKGVPDSVPEVYARGQLPDEDAPVSGEATDARYTPAALLAHVLGQIGGYRL